MNPPRPEGHEWVDSLVEDFLKAVDIAACGEGYRPHPETRRLVWRFLRTYSDENELLELALMELWPDIPEPTEKEMREGFNRVTARAKELKKTRERRLWTRRLLVAASVFASVFLFSTTGPVSSDFELTATDTLVNGSLTYENKATGNRVSSGNIKEARRAMFAMEERDNRIVSVERWAFGGGFYFSCEVASPSDSIPIFRPPGDIVVNPTTELLQVMQKRAGTIRSSFKRGDLPPLDTESITIEGIEFAFKKWEASTPEGVVEYWYGEPVSR